MSSNQPMRIPDEEQFEPVDPAMNPEAYAQAQQAIADANAAPVEDASAPDVPVPNTPALHVTLPVGAFNPMTGEEFTEAEVRELTGDDEEYFTRGKNFSEQKSRLIERGVVALGEQAPDKALLMSLCQGDREALLLAIRRATYGDVLEMSVACPACRQREDVAINLVTDVEVQTYDSPAYQYKTRSGTVVDFHWPTGDDEKAVWDFTTKNPRATTAEANTAMLTQTVDTVNGFPALGERTIRGMNMADRRELVRFIGENSPGPKLNDLRHSCGFCEYGADLEVTFEDLFR